MSSDTGEPQVYTLHQARQDAIPLWPGRDAAAEKWAVYHDRCAELFTRAAEQDPHHPNEARYLAKVEREAAAFIRERMAEGYTNSPMTWGDGVI